MDKYQIPYLNLVIRKFAERFHLPLEASYSYLSQYGGISYLIDFYDIEHTLPLDDTLDELTATCHAAGGSLI